MQKYKKVHLDFETRSRVELSTHGVDKYANDPSTDVTCMAYAFDDEPVQLWYPGLPLPMYLLMHVASGKEFWAHNATFEWYIWNYVCVLKYGFNFLPMSQTYCTMSMANAMGLLGSLDGAAQCAGLDIEKDKEGYRVMLALCKPKSDGTFYERGAAPELFAKQDKYCMKDVEIERALSKRLAPLSPKERDIWLSDQRINLRGFNIDLVSANILNSIVKKEQIRLVERFKEVTGNLVPTPASHAKFKHWLQLNGIEVESIAKDVVTKLLEDDELAELKIPPLVKEALLLRREASKTSNAKIQMMLNLEVGGVVRNGFEYYGAKQTGRWAGRKLQPQNFPKGKLKYKDIEQIYSILKYPRASEQIEMLHGDLMGAVSGMIRSLIVAKPGHKLVVADWSNIEGRGLAWLAGEEWKLEAFKAFDRGYGHDLYKVAYAESFGVSPDSVGSNERQIGKTLELACGYQGSVGAFQMMAKTLGVRVKDERAKELVEAWRLAHKKIKNYWYSVEEAATQAILEPGKTFYAGPVSRQILYVKKGSFLCCKLPSGRVSYYPYPKYEEVDAPWGGKKMSITYAYQDAETRRWTRGPTYGGSLVENLCQGICRDILAEGILRAEEKGFEVVMHIHDEIVCQVPIDSKLGVSDLEESMSVVPDWAKDFPIVAKGFESLRYKKG